MVSRSLQRVLGRPSAVGKGEKHLMLQNANVGYDRKHPTMEKACWWLSGGS